MKVRIENLFVSDRAEMELACAVNGFCPYEFSVLVNGQYSNKNETCLTFVYPTGENPVGWDKVDQIFNDGIESDNNDDDDVYDIFDPFDDSDIGEVYILVKNTMDEAVKAYSNGNEAEYARLESVAKSTLLYALEKGDINHHEMDVIADECFVIMM